MTSSGRRYEPDDDPLARECESIWFEIRRILHRRRWLLDGGASRVEAHRQELTAIEKRIVELRARSQRYRSVLRDEAWERYWRGE